MATRGLEGNTMAQPRVFGHDAKAIVIGAINTSELDNGFTFVGGTGFVAGDVGGVMTAAAAAGTTAATFVITELIEGGAILGLRAVLLGVGYTVGQTLALTGGTGNSATFTVTNIDIPNTQERGCVVYNGRATEPQDITIITEAGTTVEFKSCQPGTVVGHKAPMLAKKLVTGVDCVAIY